MIRVGKPPLRPAVLRYRPARNRATERPKVSPPCPRWCRDARRGDVGVQCIATWPASRMVATGLRHRVRYPPFWTVRAAAMSSIEDIRSWVFCASARRCGEARVGRWQAVGEIQIGALVPEGYEDSGSLINALTRVAR